MILAPHFIDFWCSVLCVTVIMGVKQVVFVSSSPWCINSQYFTGELDGNRPVPFRLTPNLAELVTSIGVSGPFTASMVATARCLATPSFKVSALLRAIMRDEIISWHKVSLGFML